MSNWKCCGEACPDPQCTLQRSGQNLCFWCRGSSPPAGRGRSWSEAYSPPKCLDEIPKFIAKSYPNIAKLLVNTLKKWICNKQVSSEEAKFSKSDSVEKVDTLKKYWRVGANRRWRKEKAQKIDLLMLDAVQIMHAHCPALLSTQYRHTAIFWEENIIPQLFTFDLLHKSCLLSL